MRRVYLTLDLATKTGFAHWEPGSKPILGTYTMPSVNGQIGRSLSKFAGWLTNFLQIAEVTDVQYEKPYLKPSGHKRTASGNFKLVNGTSPDAAKVLYTLGSRTEEICYDLGIRCYEAEVADWRRHLIGNNPKRDIAHKQTKEELLARGISFKGQDQADAMGQLIYMAHSLKLKPDWPVGRHRGTVFNHKRAS